MTKKIAVIVCDRQEEALRMSIGLTLADDEIDIYFLDKKLRKNKDTELNIETGRELGIGMYSTCTEENSLKRISPELMATRLLEYDHILPY